MLGNSYIDSITPISGATMVDTGSTRFIADWTNFIDKVE